MEKKEHKSPPPPFIKRGSNSFPAMEEKVLEFWDKNKIFEKTVDNPPSSLLVRGERPDYVFYDGPPFITGLPHYATLLPSIAKDVVPRFWTMKGYRVERKWGWDCHGLPAENQVEKQLQLKNKKDIEKLGVDKFIDACRTYVSVGSEQWEWYINRIGRWVDMKHAYKTMDLPFMESVIWAFKELFNQGLIYEGYRSSLHCPRCATPLSKFEITMDAGSYRDVTDTTVVVKFKTKLTNDEQVNLLAWTTTPWTLPGNLALAVGEKIVYIKAKINNEIYIIAKDRAKEILKDFKYEIIGELKGKELVGLIYEPVFDLNNDKIKNNKNVFKVYTAEFVTTEDGTGIVHIAPNFGEDDFELGKKQNLPVVDLMDENGIYTNNAGEWAGLYFSKVGKKVLADLGEKLISSFSYTHSYPHCYRCGTPLIYRAQKAWYLKISELRDNLIKSNERINWVPDHFKEGRFRYNLEAAPDWSLSRSRYWGSPIPVWKCDQCQEMKVVGSLKEIEELSGKKIFDLHKPVIDGVKFKCTKCDGTMKRVKEVLDCWFESGSMPFAQFHYPFEKSQEWKNSFPADFIIEYTGQLRGWFYYLHVLGNALFKKIAFRNVIVTGVLAGTDGRKMSKSYGNYPDPKATLEKYGSDALRMYFMSSPIMLGDDMNFSEVDLQTSLRKNVILPWNVLKFYEMFEDKPTVKPPAGGQKSKVENDNILDKWILVRLSQLIKEVTDGLEAYNLPAGARAITIFIDDLSTWYLRRSRDRFKADDVMDKQAALATTKHVLVELAKVIAPYMPFMAETIWQNVTGYDFKDKDKSVNLEEWPAYAKASAGKPEKTFVDSIILEEMAGVRKIVELGLAKRDEAGIKVRQALGKFSIFNFQFSMNEEYLDLIKEELNVKEVTATKGKGELKVELDITITDELKLEGLKREIVRLVNNMRKDAGLTIKDRIVLSWQSESEMVKKVFGEMEKELKKDTLSAEIRESDIEGKEVKVNGESVKLEIKKI